MLINAVLGNLRHESKWTNFPIDYVDFEWYELDKKLIRKQSIAKQDIGIQLTRQSSSLNDGDILAQLDNRILVVRVVPTQAIAITPRNNHELAKACYEIGNRHAPLFFAPEDNNNTLLVAYDEPMLQLLHKLQLTSRVVTAQLIHRIGSTAHHHEH